MRKVLTTLACLLLTANIAFADEPFRNHRYDAFKVLPVNEEHIVFIGNSITNMHEWWEAFGSNHNIINRGVSGAVTEEALANIEAIAAGKPKKVFIMMGTNDLGTSGINTAEHVLGNINLMVERFQKCSPETEIYIQSILPSTVGIRTLELEQATNETLKSMCEEKGITFIDLWDDLYSVCQDYTHTLDGIHLKASGYAVWCNKIAEYVGSDCVYPEDCVTEQSNGGQSGAYGMRITQFSTLPVNEGDILIIGDEMIHGGEWHELLKSGKVKSRGTAWGYPGPSLDITLAEIPYILNSTSGSCKPSKILLYAGVSDVNGSTEIATLVEKYQSIVDKITELTPDAKLYLMSLQPTATASTNTGRVVPFNESLQTIADANDNIEYIDIYTDFVSSDVASGTYFSGNYLYGKGYIKVAQTIAATITDEGLTAVTDDEADAAYTAFENRSALGSAIVTARSIPEGDGVGEYSSEGLAELTEAVNEAYALLASGTATTEEMTQAAEAITTATDEIRININMPEASTDDNEVWYKLYTPQRDSRYLTSQGAGMDVVGNAENNYARSMWKFVERTDGTFNIVNRNDASYLNPASSYNTAITTTASEPSSGWSLSYSNTIGLYIISSGTVQLNQTQSNLNYKVYNWSSGQSGTDRSDTGCQYKIELVTEEPDVDNTQPNQITSLDGITNGWYQIVAVSGSLTDMTTAISAGKTYITNATAEYRQSASNFYPLKYAALDEDNPVLSYIYITKSGSSYYLTSLNGHKLNENFTASRTVPSSLTSISGSDGVFSVGKSSAYNSGGSEQPYVGKYSSSSTTYNIFTVSDLEEYTVYNVVISGADDATEIADDVQITCTNSAVKGLASVYNGGWFFVPAGTIITADDFTMPSISGKNAQLSIADGIITLTYMTGNYADVSAKIDEATALLENTTEGDDPACFSTADRKTLQTAIDAASEFNNTDGKSDSEIEEAISTLAAAMEAYEATRNDVKYSTEGDETWYYIVSVATNSYCSGKAIKSTEDAPLTYAAKTIDPTMVWCFEQDENGKVAIRNYAGGYMSKKQDRGNSDAGMTDDAAYNYTITRYADSSEGDRAFIIQSDASSNPIHAQEYNTIIVTWAASADNASLWGLYELTADELESQITITSTTVEQAVANTGIGNTDVALLRISFTSEGLNGTKSLEGIKGNLNNTTDVAKVKFYSVSDEYEYRTDKEDATLLGEAVPAADGTFNVVFDTPVALQSGSGDYLWLVADISETAVEGNVIDAEITSYTVGGEDIAETNGNPEYSTTIFLSASTVEYLNTHDSRYYRIPGITTNNKGWLVAVTDKRFSSNGDLPNNIDVVARVSKDNGATWSDPVTIAGTSELGGDYGHGDPAIVTDRKTGDVIVLVTSKVGFFYGTPDAPPLTKMIVSHNGGFTWDAPVDITSSIYGAECDDEERSQYYSLFVSSGSFMQASDGTLMAVAPVRTTSSTTHSTFEAHIISSSDHGATWTMSNVAALTDADESKIVELDNGDLLVSSRHANYRYHATSSDGGATWSTRKTWSELYEPGCNGDMIRLTSKSGGSDKNRLLHSIPNAGSRKNVTVFLSTDEGESWPTKKSICPKGSAYSSLTVLPDGTIGCYYEEDGLEGGYQMRFIRFSLSWLTDGADSITAEDVNTSIRCIEEIETTTTSADDSTYDLMGNKVLETVKGRIYIRNNKKFIAR